MTDPYIPEFTDYVQKIRRNSVAISAIALVMVFAGVSISSDFATSGFKITGLDDKTVKLILLILTTYWLIHFIWCSADYFTEWRLRLTEVKMNPGTWDHDYEEDPGPKSRQATMMKWLFYRQKPLQSFVADLEDIKLRLQERDIDETETRRIFENIDSGIRSIQDFSRTPIDTQVIKSINNFDTWLARLNNSQSIRWIVIELLLPIALGLIAITKLAIQVIPQYVQITG
ncbi:hypothetical protein C0058_11255 [Pseudomonas sp. NC02]|nr:hypothetical protein C0058_11255 [Pseudomonas sp. NC02]